MGAWNRPIAGLFLSVVWLGLSCSLAFLSPSVTTARHASIASALLAQVPVINEWEIKKNGSISGVVRNHPTIPNGDVITTSPLAIEDLTSLQDNQLVSTKSGSQYRLGKSANRVVTSVPTPPANSAAAKKPAGTSRPAATTSATQKEQYNLNGKSVGNGRYLLIGQKLKSTSIRSEIYYAYRASSDGTPTGPRVTVKVSTNLAGLERENEIYNKVNGGLFYRDNFVRKIDYLPDAQGSRGFGKNCGALVGRTDPSCSL